MTDVSDFSNSVGSKSSQNNCYNRHVILSKFISTLFNMKGHLLISLVTANTTYTTFDVVYTKIMLYTQQVLFSQSDKSCLYRDTSCISTTRSSVRTSTCCMSTDTVVYPGTHVVYLQIQHVLDV